MSFYIDGTNNVLLHLQLLLLECVEHNISYVVRNEWYVQEYTLSITYCVTCNLSSCYVLLTESRVFGVCEVYEELYIA